MKDLSEPRLARPARPLARGIARRGMLHLVLAGCAMPGLLVPARPATAQLASHTPGQTGRVWHVSGTGSDAAGTGTENAPFRQPSAALPYAQPGDTILLRPGLYQPLQIDVSGAPGAPLTVTTLDAERNQAIIDGSGSPKRNGITLRGQSHVVLRNLTIRNIRMAAGIAISSPGGLSGNHLVETCLIHGIDTSAIRCIGLPPGRYDGANTRIYTENVTLRGNQIFDAFRKGGPGNEVITVGGGVRNIITEDNLIYDSLQYGIDYKRGVDGGIIRNNTIHGIQKHAIYVDSSVSYIRNLAIYGNRAWNCNNGLVLAREALGQDTQTIENLSVYNNIFHSMRRYGLLCYAHPGDGPYGAIRNVAIKFNTLYNCGLSNDRLQEMRLVDWDGRAYRTAGVVSGFDIVGNLIWRDPARGPAGVKNSFEGAAGFAVAGNVSQIDPLFGDVAARPGDFRPSPASKIASNVIGHSAAPYDRDILGQSRPDPASPGAHQKIGL